MFKGLDVVLDTEVSCAVRRFGRDRGGDGEDLLRRPQSAMEVRNQEHRAWALLARRNRVQREMIVVARRRDDLRRRLAHK